jgi:uncharacterized protein YciI
MRVVAEADTDEAARALATEAEAVITGVLNNGRAGA